MPTWVNQGIAEYTKRLPQDFKLEFEEIPLGKRTNTAKSSSSTKSQDHKAKQQEGATLLAKLKNSRDKIIALEVQGQNWSSHQLSQKITNWRMEGQDITLLIGGPDGLSQECLDLAAEHWSLSALTLPHPLVRVILAEQLYRAWTLISGHPYHR